MQARQGSLLAVWTMYALIPSLPLPQPPLSIPWTLCFQSKHPMATPPITFRAQLPHRLQVPPTLPFRTCQVQKTWTQTLLNLRPKGVMAEGFQIVKNRETEKSLVTWTVPFERNQFGNHIRCIENAWVLLVNSSTSVCCFSLILLSWFVNNFWLYF